MKNMRYPTKTFSAAFLAGCLTWTLPLCAQAPDSSPQSDGTWHKFGTRPDPAGVPAPAQNQGMGPAVVHRVPAQLVLPAGSWITLRVNQFLTSDHNQAGDAFTATLSQPLTADGYVVARRGQTIVGRVAQSSKGGRVKGTSSLGLEITEISLVDGRQMPVRTQLIERTGGTSQGRDVAAVASTAGVGAAIGAVAAGGFGAGLGAIAGAGAATIGVLSTHGRATEVYPEMALTFRSLEPLTISTERTAMAFRPVTQTDYETRQLVERAGPPRMAASPYYYGGYGYPYPYYYSPFYYGYGPSFYFYGGPRFYYGGHGYHR